MKERPILFSSPMVRAILAGKKTQTRRIVKPQGTTIEPMVFPNGSSGWRTNVAHPNGTTTALTCPYGSTGDRLWMRETWATDRLLDTVKPSHLDDTETIFYLADGTRRGNEVVDQGKTRVSIFMPRWASRVMLEIVGLRVQRVQSISREDALAEGIVSGGIPADEYGPERIGWMVYPDDGKSVLSVSPEREYEKLWDQINGERAAWSTNPWVWVIAFRMVKS